MPGLFLAADVGSSASTGEPLPPIIPPSCFIASRRRWDRNQADLMVTPKVRWSWCELMPFLLLGWAGYAQEPPESDDGDFGERSACAQRTLRKLALPTEQPAHLTHHPGRVLSQTRPSYQNVGCAVRTRTNGSMLPRCHATIAPPCPSAIGVEGDVIRCSREQGRNDTAASSQDNPSFRVLEWYSSVASRRRRWRIWRMNRVRRAHPT